MSTTTGPYGRTVYNWSLSFDLDVLAEISVEQARRVLPAGINPVEPRPGVALLSVAHVLFDAGNLGYLPAFHELACSIIVHPEVTREVLPDFAHYTLRVGSECSAFLRWARHRDRMPIDRGEGFQMTIDREAQSCHSEDARGPICSVANTHPTPTYIEDVLNVQVLSEVDGVRYVNHCRWAGEKFEHQRADAVLRVHDHPFFAGLDLGEAELRCYLQMVTPPRTAAILQFSDPLRVS